MTPQVVPGPLPSDVADICSSRSTAIAAAAIASSICCCTTGQTRSGVSSLMQSIRSQVRFRLHLHQIAGLNGRPARAERTGENGICAGIDANDPSAGRGGQVQRARVVRDQQVRLSHKAPRAGADLVRPHRSRIGIGPQVFAGRP